MTSSSITTNQFRSTNIYGTFNNFDKSNKSILASGNFQRNLSVGGNLILGTETIDANNNAIDSDSNIQFTLDKVLYNIPLRTLSYIKNLSSDVQQQIQDIEQPPSNSGIFTNITASGTFNGLKIKDYGNGNTSFSSGNTDILGSSNSRFGYFTGFLYGYSNAVFGDQSLQNCTGNSNTAIGHNSQNSNTNNSYNTSLGSNSDIAGGHSNVAIGCIAQCNNCSNSVALGANVTCNTNNQILLGNHLHTVSIPGNLSCDGLLSANRLSTSGDLTCNGLISANRLSTSGDLTCNGLISANRLSATGSITFYETLNNISTTTFSYLSGVTSSIQEQLNEVYLNIYTYLPNQINFSINQLKNQIAPAGSIITYAGTSTTLDGYFLCDGSSYNSSNYSNLFEAIGYTYGGTNGNFKVPNYKGIFLRGVGSQDVQLRVIAGGGGPIIKQYTAPPLGTTVIDQSTFFETSNYVDSISTTTKTVVTGMSPNLATLSTTSVIGSVNYSTTNNFYNPGNEETHPVHASVNYFIKY